jgi:hypothetical protein
LPRLPPLPPYAEALLDAVLLSAVMFPLLYILVFRPMRLLMIRSQEEVKTLRGIVPICSVCKRIRTGRTSWTKLEAYVHTHSAARFSHGLCQDCIRETYPDDAEKIIEQMDAADD